MAGLGILPALLNTASQRRGLLLVPCGLAVLAYFGGTIVHALAVIPHDGLVAAETAIAGAECVPQGFEFLSSSPC